MTMQVPPAVIEYVHKHGGENGCDLTNLQKKPDGSMVLMRVCPGQPDEEIPFVFDETKKQWRLKD